MLKSFFHTKKTLNTLIISLALVFASIDLFALAESDDELPAEVGWNHLFRKERTPQKSKWKDALSKKLIAKLDQSTQKHKFAGKVLICQIYFGLSKDGFITSFKFDEKSDNKSFDSLIEKTFKSMSKEKIVPESSNKDAVRVLTYIELSNGKYQIHQNELNFHSH